MQNSPTENTTQTTTQPPPENSVQELASTAQEQVAAWYQAFVSEYVYNPDAFMRNALQLKPTWQQQQLLDLVNDNNRIAVRAGHGVGKTTVTAAVCLWFLICRPYSRVLCTAPNISILHKVLMPEIVSHLNRLTRKHPPIKELFDVTRSTAFSKIHPQEWFLVCRTARKESSQGIAGQHSENLLIVCEEASSIDEGIYETLDGALTGGEGNKIVMIGNPVQTHGRFYDAFHAKRDSYATLHWNGEDSPLVSKEMIQNFREEYGEGSREYDVRVKGVFPAMVSGMLLNRPDIVACEEREILFDQTGLDPMRIVSVDVAGSGRDSSVIMVMEVTGDGTDRLARITDIREYQIGVDTVQLAGELIFLAKSFPCKIIVDSVGVGQGVSDTLTHNDISHIALNWGQPSWYKERFYNQRAEAWHWLREAISRKAISLPRHPKLYDQLSNIPYGYSDRGKLQMWSKDRMASKGIKSPDLGDALAQSFLVPYEPPMRENLASSWQDQQAGFSVSNSVAPPRQEPEDSGDVLSNFYDTDW